MSNPCILFLSILLVGWELEHAVAAAFMGDAAVAPATSPFDKGKAIAAASVIDCIGACIYFIVTLGLIVLARRRAEDADVHTVTIHDYSVYVRKLPQEATSNELVDFFGQWGEVGAYVKLCRLGWPHTVEAQALRMPATSSCQSGNIVCTAAFGTHH